LKAFEIIEEITPLTTHHQLPCFCRV